MGNDKSFDICYKVQVNGAHVRTVGGSDVDRLSISLFVFSGINEVSFDAVSKDSGRIVDSSWDSIEFNEKDSIKICPCQNSLADPPTRKKERSAK